MPSLPLATAEPVLVWEHRSAFFLHHFSPAAVCHEVPEQPVVSPASGHVFEKRLVVKYVEESGTDPINGEPLAVEQLIDINGADRLAANEHGGGRVIISS